MENDSLFVSVVPQSWSCHIWIQKLFFRIEKDLEKELDETESTEKKQEPKKMNQTNTTSLKKDLLKNLSQESKTESKAIKISLLFNK